MPNRLNLPNRFGFLRSRLFSNVLSLYSVQIADYVLPIVVVIIVSRLGAETYGLVAFSQSYGATLTLFMEYGFVYSATREVSRARGDRDQVAAVISGVTGAKLTLSFLGILLSVFAWFLVAVFRVNPLFLAGGLLWAIGQASSYLWLYQGLERVKLLALVDSSMKFVATLAIWWLVRRPEDAWAVLIIQGAASVAAAFVGFVLAVREFRPPAPGFESTRKAFKMGWSMFVFRSSVSLFSSANAFILGFFVSPQFVGYYAAAEKVARAMLAALNPIAHVLFARMSHLAKHAMAEARVTVKRSLAVMSSGGILLGAVAFVLAPFFVQLVFGRDFAPAVEPLRVLCLLPFLNATSNVLGLQWMVPLGLDRTFNATIVAAGALNLTLAFLLAPAYSHVGMAVAVIMSEAFVVVILLAYLYAKRRDPFRPPSP